MQFARRRARVSTKRIVRTLIAAVIAILLSASPAQAHPTLLETLPRAGFGYSESPVEIGMTFDQPVAIQTLTVQGQARGRIATTKPTLSPDNTKVTVRPKRQLGDGNYTVRWQITAEDGDIVDGTFSFGIGVNASSGPGAGTSSDTVGLTSVALLRWLLFSGLAVALGGVVGDSVVRDRARRAKVRFDVDLSIPRPWTRLGSLIGMIAAGLLLFNQVGQGNAIDGISRFSLDEATGSTTGRILLIELVGFAFALVLATTNRRALVGLGLVPVLAAESWRTHTHASGGFLGSATIGIHLLVASLWVGVLVHLVRAALRWRSEPRQIVAVFRRYSRFAFGGYLIVIATGTLAAILVVPSWGALTGTTYGRVLLIKIGAVVVVTGLVLSARRGLKKSVSTHRWRGFRFARLEQIVLVAVLGITALLTAESPVPSTSSAAFPTPVEGDAVYLGHLIGQVSTGLIVSKIQLQVRLHVPEENSQSIQKYRVTGTLHNARNPSVGLTLKPCGPGCFAAPFTPRGDSLVVLNIKATGWTGGQAEFTLPTAPQDGAVTIRRMLATMKRQENVSLRERVTSNTARPEGMTSSLRLTGAAFIEAQPYRAGIVSGATVLMTSAKTTKVAFALTAEDVYEEMTLDSTGRIVRESTVTPNHLITRTFSYAKG